MLTTIAVVATAILAVATSRGGAPLVRLALTQAKRRTIGSAMRDMNVTPPARWGFWRRSVYARASYDAVRGFGSTTVAEECAWLDSHFSNDPRQEQGGFLEVGLSGVYRNAWTRERRIERLADAYAAYASRLRAQARLATSRLVQEEVEVALATARFLRAEASFSDIDPQQWGEFNASLLRSGQDPGTDQVDLRLRFAPISPSPSFHLDGLSVVPVAERVVLEDSPAEGKAQRDGIKAVTVPSDPSSLSAIAQKLSSRMFDGVLPTLIHCRAQYDSESGRRRLRVLLGQTNFSVLLQQNYVGNVGIGRTREQLAAELCDEVPRVLTLSCIPRTTDHRLILVRRSEFVAVAAGLLAPGVNGNLELRSRHGLDTDRDECGFPSPVLAIVREGAEELGLDIDPTRVEIVGLGTFSYAEEVGTHVLLGKAQTGLSTEQVAAGLWRADATEGAWEVGHEIVAIGEPHSLESAERLVRWALLKEDLAPHARLALLSICLPLLRERRVNDNDPEPRPPLAVLKALAQDPGALPTDTEIGLQSLSVRTKTVQDPSS
ncbi:MAG: hypothetical protein AB7H92_07900 [Microbacteriaceae bacterium]